MVRADMTVCCVLGDPVAHSLSPLIHNAGYRALNLNFIYAAFRVKNIELAIGGIRGLGIRGASVTIPHKVSALKYMDEVEETARQIGAINTIVNDGGALRGFNTDYAAALRALGGREAIEGKRAVLIGAGGTALTIATGLKKSGASVLILNRTPAKAAELAKATGADGSGGLERLPEIARADFLINTTPVGLPPDTEETIVPRAFLYEGLTVFDVVYNPLETRLIKEAKQAGCTVIRGYSMFLYQAAAQFELFTGHEAPLAVMEKALLDALEGGKDAAPDGG